MKKYMSLISTMMCILVLYGCMQATTTPATYAVTYNGNGATGTAPTDSNAYAQLDAVTVTTGIGSLVNNGYTLAGWMTKIDGTGTSYAPGTTFSMGPANVTLYAVWIPNELSFASSGTNIILLGHSSLPTGAFSIPNGVTALGGTGVNGPFSGCSGLTSVSFPPSLIQTTGINAFMACTGLTSISLPTNFLSLGANTFLNCTGLITVNLPAALTYIGMNAFSGCSALTTITISAIIPPTLGSGAFDGLETGFQIKVPSASVLAYQSNADWSPYSANIVSQ